MKTDREKRDDEAKRLETKFLEDASAGVRSRSRNEEEDLTEQEMKDLDGG